jgi:uncharacterized protein YbjT (DUF2867 family)
MSTRSPEVLVQPAAADLLRCRGKRVVLTTSTELSFCGIARELLEVDGRQGALVETDPATGFSFWCPLPHIQRLTVVPIADQPVEQDQGSQEPAATTGAA